MNILQWLVVTFAVFGLSWGNSISAQCGRKRPEGLISKGDEVARNSWPWLAALIYKSVKSEKNGKFFCSATLISSRSVITAAHCMQKKLQKTRLNPSDFDVHLGRHNLRDNEELKELAKVLDPIMIIAMHPDWSPTDYSNSRYDADLALLISSKSIETSPFIFPVCLLDQDATDILSKKGTIVGWGFSSDDNREIEDIPRQTQVERVPILDCILEEGILAIYSSKRAYCVKGSDEGASPCRGDSGGGFFVESRNVWYTLGIVSSGITTINCPVSKHSLFTEIRPFTNWIDQGIQKFYEVQFTYSLKHYTDETGPLHVFYIAYMSLRGAYHTLLIPEVLRSGAFLSAKSHPVDFEVERLACYDQDWGLLPNNIGYIFPNLKDLKAFRLRIKSIERLNFKNMERLQILTLTNNEIKLIPSDCFEDLKGLTHFHIFGNQLKTIHEKTFFRNPSLQEIDLNYNQMQSTELKNLKNMNVENLWLDGNQLESLPFDAFDGLKNLTKISLHSNKLTTFHKDTFLNNFNLQDIFAYRNRFENLPEGLFRNNNNLKYLDIRWNKITEINTKFKSLGTYAFKDNTCINESFFPSDQIMLDEMNESLGELCGKK